MIRPVIGICTPVEHARWGHWDRPAVLLAREYVDMVQRTGALVVLLPPDRGATEDPDQLLDLIDGLILAGGVDVTPETYDAPRHPKTDPGSPERDEFEVAMVRRALERDLPVLGICRGMELLNVVRGGRLVEHLDDVELHLHTPGSYTDHGVVLEPGSLAARAFGQERFAVRSHHHQGLGELGEGLIASGHSEPDGLVEAVELPSCRFVLALLWHAEEERQTSVFEAFAEAARQQAVAA